MAKAGDDTVIKSNAEVVKDYHKQLSTIKVRFPAKEVCGVDYAALMRERAVELGMTDTKGKGSANAYILHLIERDLVETGKIDKMVKGVRQIDKGAKGVHQIVKK